MTINLEETLGRAETLFYQFQRMVEAVDRKREEFERQKEIGQKEGLRARKGKEEESDALSKIPEISELLRDLLKKGWVNP